MRHDGDMIAFFVLCVTQDIATNKSRKTVRPEERMIEYVCKVGIHENEIIWAVYSGIHQVKFPTPFCIMIIDETYMSVMWLNYNPPICLQIIIYKPMSKYCCHIINACLSSSVLENCVISE